MLSFQGPDWWQKSLSYKSQRAPWPQERQPWTDVASVSKWQWEFRIRWSEVTRDGHESYDGGIPSSELSVLRIPQPHGPRDLHQPHDPQDLHQPPGPQDHPIPWSSGPPPAQSHGPKNPQHHAILLHPSWYLSHQATASPAEFARVNHIPGHSQHSVNASCLRAMSEGVNEQTKEETMESLSDRASHRVNN